MVALPLSLLRRRPVPVVLGVTLVLVVLAGLLWRPVFGAGHPPSRTVVLSTGTTTGVYARYGQLLRDQLTADSPTLDVRLLPSEGSLRNIGRLVTGEADVAVATVDSVAAYQQRGGRGADRLRACARLYDDYVQLVVPANSRVRSAADLKGLRVGVGQDRSGVQLVARELLAAAGLDMDTDVTAVRKGIDAVPRMLEAGRLDAFFWSGGLPTAAVDHLAGLTDVRLVPLGDLLPALHARGGYREYYRAAVMPPDVYPDIDSRRAVDTIAVANLLVTTAEADTELVEQLTRSVINGRDRIGREVHAAQRVDLRTAIYTQPLELHPGAVAYYRSVKL